MRFKQLFTLAALSLAGCAVLADEAPSAPLTRAQVVQSFLAARAAGTLPPAGEGSDGPEYPKGAVTSTVSRAEVKNEVIEARAAGTLLRAGQGEDTAGYPLPGPVTSTVTRAQVRNEVLEARANGELIPAGQEDPFMVPVTHATHTAASPSVRLLAHTAN